FLKKYSMLSKHVFKECKCLHIAADSSEIGGNNLELVALCNGDKNIGAWAPPQVLSAFNVTTNSPDEPLDPILLGAANRRALAFALHEPLGDNVGLPTPKRVAGAKHMFAWDNAMRQAGLQGLSKFIANEDETPLQIQGLPHIERPEQRPDTIVFSLDQGPTSYATHFYMLYAMKMNLFCHYDVSHRLWNDVKDAFCECGEWNFIRLSTIVLNSDFGPWDGSAYFNKGGSVLKNFGASCGASHPLFVCFHKAIATELGIPIEGNDEKFLEGVFLALKESDAWDTKNVNIGLSRWSGWHDSAQHFLKRWSTRHLTYVWLSIVRGYGRSTDEGWTLIPTFQDTAPKAAEAADAEPMKYGSAKVDAMRARCKNTMHLVTAWMSDSMNKRKLVAFVRLCDYLREHQSYQNKLVRSPHEAQEYFEDVVRGKALEPLDDMFKHIISKPDGLETLGFHIAFAITDDLDECDAIEERGWAAKLMQFSFQLVKHRLMSLSHYLWSLPGCFILCLSADKAEHAALNQFLKMVWRSWEGFMESGFQDTAFWKPIKNRHVLQQQLVRKFMRQSIEHNFERIDAVQEQTAKDLVAGFCQTKVLEDSFHVASEFCNYEVRNGKVPPKSIWENIINHRTMSQKHRYHEVAVGVDTRLPLSEKGRKLDTDLFESTQ
ncbi:unnamed protein product, partial [Prorocentrum cordatum]